MILKNDVCSMCSSSSNYNKNWLQLACNSSTNYCTRSLISSRNNTNTAATATATTAATTSQDSIINQASRL